MVNWVLGCLVHQKWAQGCHTGDEVPARGIWSNVDVVMEVTLGFKALVFLKVSGMKPSDEETKSV
jgi:hypothetical protein